MIVGLELGLYTVRRDSKERTKDTENIPWRDHKYVNVLDAGA